MMDLLNLLLIAETEANIVGLVVDRLDHDLPHVVRSVNRRQGVPAGLSGPLNHVPIIGCQVLHEVLLVLHQQDVTVGERLLDLSARLALAFLLIAYFKGDHQVGSLARVEVTVDVKWLVDAKHLIGVVGLFFSGRVERVKPVACHSIATILAIFYNL